METKICILILFYLVHKIIYLRFLNLGLRTQFYLRYDLPRNFLALSNPRTPQPLATLEHMLTAPVYGVTAFFSPNKPSLSVRVSATNALNFPWNPESQPEYPQLPAVQ